MKRLLATGIAASFLCAIAQADSGQLDRIFACANIYAPVAQLEKIAGKPVSIDGDERIYQVGQCRGAIYADSINNVPDIVQEIDMEISPACTFDLSRVVDVPRGTYVHELTFGQFRRLMHNPYLCPPTATPDNPDYPSHQKEGAVLDN